MPHVVLVPLTGFRVKEDAMRELGMTLPGFQPRAEAVQALPALGLLTLAGMMPDNWTSRFLPVTNVHDEVIESIVGDRPDLVAVSALTASVDEAYHLSSALRAEKIPVVIGGLHATVCPEEAGRFYDAVIVGDGEPVWQRVLHDLEAGELSPVRNRLQIGKRMDRKRMPVLTDTNLLRHGIACRDAP